jgi:FtsZ-binding cell division protein ZapB
MVWHEIGDAPAMRRKLAAAICGVLLGMPATAWGESVEDRLREALRHATVDLRAAQDTQAALQAALEEAQKQRDALQQQVAQLTAQAAAAPPAPSAAPPPPPAEMQQLRDQIAALQKRNAALQDGLAHWQSAYRQAAALAQSKDAESRLCGSSLSTARTTLGACAAKNTRLIAVANDILHLYQTPHFRSLVSGSWEPLLGYKRVELENLVQDNTDRILDQKYYTGEQPAASPARSGAAP